VLILKDIGDCLMTTKCHPAKLARFQRGLRQIDLSIEAGIPTSEISYYENGLKKPSAAKARALNAILGQKVYDEEELKGNASLLPINKHPVRKDT